MEKNKPYAFPEHFRDFVLMPKFDENIENLSVLAEPEDWDYKLTPSSHSKPVLRNYLTYSYRRVAEKKDRYYVRRRICMLEHGLNNEEARTDIYSF